MQWACLNELGLEYAPPLPERAAEVLHFPVLVERASDGTTLIVDELGKEKGIPIRAECRTILVDRERRILYDSLQAGIEDGYGCLVDDGHIALLRRTKWELLISSRSGKPVQTISLARFSKRLPRFFARTWKGTFLVVLLDRAGALDVVEFDDKGHMLWFLPENAAKLGVPGSVELLSNDNLLLSDEFYHVALELRRDGSIVWQYGERKNPSDAADRLSSPKSIRASADGRRTIADTRNHRIVVIASATAGANVEILPVHLSSPTYADTLENGNYLVCDSGNARVIELDKNQNIVWQYGAELARRRLFSFPRSVELNSDGDYLIADTAQNRVVLVRGNVYEPLPLAAGQDLFWPRCARRLPGDSVLIADGRNSRVIELSADGQVARTLARLDDMGGINLADPHDVRLLPNGHLLMVDAAINLAVETDWLGKVFWCYGTPKGPELDDPHSIQMLADGKVLIADTGHHRLLVVDQDGAVAQEIKVLQRGTEYFRLNRPRYAEVSPDGILVIADTGNNRILGSEWRGELLWQIKEIPGSRLPLLDQPRWAQAVSRAEVVICDHYHHRIVHLKATPLS